MLRQIINVFKALNSNAKPWQLSLGVSFGAIIGLTPTASLHNLALLFLAFIINMNIGIMILSFVLFSGIAYILDPVFHDIGYTILKSDSLVGIWENVFSCPIALMANLNNSIVMGSLVVSVALAVPLFFMFNKFIEKYREKLQIYMEKFPIFRSLKILRVYQTITGGRG
ncbi:MAG: TIGR03546 family protein [Nitrospinae bacterium]|nr:TIGR03546 family protein [Nitrospinota bacterium]